MTLTYALSVRNFIDDVGSYAGFAAFVAVALFSLLVFAQAREIKRLRDWGADAHDRLGELERAVASAQELARRALSSASRAPQAAPTQAPRPVAGRGRPAAAAPGAAVGAAAAAAQRVASTSAPVRPQLLPAAPIGVGGPALASATALIPLPGTPESTATTVAPEPVAVPARAAIAALGAGARERTVPATGRPATPRGREAVAASVVQSNGHDDQPTEFGEHVEAPQRGRTAAPPAPPRREPPARPAGRGPVRPQPAGARGGNGGRGGQQPPQDAPHGRRRLVGILAAAAVLIVIVVVAVLVLGHNGSSPSRSVRVDVPTGATRHATRRAASRAQTRGPPAPPPANTTVSVLNGTTTTGLAARVMTQLTTAGYRAGGTGDATDPNRSATVVEYREGAQAAANAVARALGLSSDTVSQMVPETETAACATENPCIATVVVTVGADRAQ